MRLKAGTSVGPYEILAPIGAGGMGEVYRARDPRLGREVAIKILPSAVAGEPERLRRFEQEARAAGALNHPNVLAVHDVGTHEGVPYIVSELLAGESLRTRIGGTPLPTRKVLDYSVQVARGLSAAHEKGIVHRDLKPDNVFVTRDGRVKILDFGLAKLGPEGPLAPAAPDPAFSAAETATGTRPGTLLGTLGYMSPEQVQGHVTDARSDIFAFGTVLYEMLTGQRAFKAETAPETLTAILKQDPLETVPAEVEVAPGLERVLRHCLEKSPDERFQSARDLAFALETLSGTSEAGSAKTLQATSRWPRRWPLAAVAALALVAAVGALAGKKLWFRPPTRFTQLTFRAGTVSSARFAPDGQTIAYSAAWDGAPLELYTRRLTDQQARPLDVRGARILSISRSGEAAVQLLAPGAMAAFFSFPVGTLARVPLSGGLPRELLEQTLSADWSPDGSELAVSRWVDGKCRLEYPIGHVLHESQQAILAVRISPRGDQVAFLEQVSLVRGQRVALLVVNRAGERKALFEGWGLTGLAWSPNGNEIWVDVYGAIGSRSLRAVTLSGKSRLLIQLGGTEGGLLDVSRDGRALVYEGHGRYVVYAQPPGADRERNLSWRSDSTLVDLSRDGRSLLLTEILSSGGSRLGTAIRKTDATPAVRLGDGYGYALSPDGRWALAFVGSGSALEFVLWPTGPGEPIRIAEGLPAEFHGASWLPDSRSFVFSGSQPGEVARLYEQDIAGGPPRPLAGAEDDLTYPVVSPDGTRVAAIDAYGGVVAISARGGETLSVPGVEAGEIPVQWTADARALYVYRPDALPVQIFAVDTRTGNRRLLRELELPGITGAEGNVIVALTPDARSYAYSFRRPLDELYLLEGLD
jgi:serine/threonine protein kinase/Tol biopolymer transport system component